MKIKARGLSLPSAPAPAESARTARAAAAVQGGAAEKVSLRLPCAAHRTLRLLSLGTSMAEVIGGRLDAHRAQPDPAVFTRSGDQVLQVLAEVLRRRGVDVDDPARVELTSAMLAPAHARQLRELAAGHGLPAGAVLARLLVAYGRGNAVTR